MTEQMAIEVLKEIVDEITEEDGICYVTDCDKEPLDMAIQALKEIQQYRAIGTVEDIYNMLEVLNRTISELHSEVSKYRKLGTIEELQALKEKSVAKKPVLVKRGFVQFYPCPNPNCSNPNKYMQVYPGQKYCVYCGQHLDWE